MRATKVISSKSQMKQVIHQLKEDKIREKMGSKREPTLEMADFRLWTENI
jgi:hypothetical protein